MSPSFFYLIIIESIAYNIYMVFYDELRDIISEGKEIFSESKIIISDSRGVYVEGHKGLLSISNEEISCKLKKGLLKISGNNLRISSVMKDVLSVVGKIDNVSFIC